MTLMGEYMPVVENCQLFKLNFTFFFEVFDVL